MDSARRRNPPAETAAKPERGVLPFSAYDLEMSADLVPAQCQALALALLPKHWTPGLHLAVPRPQRHPGEWRIGRLGPPGRLR
jgi:hypothetical protein